MRMLAIEVADRRHETPALHIDAVGQAERLKESFLDADAVIGSESKCRPAGKVGIDIGAQHKFRFAETEAAFSRTYVSAWKESLQAVLCRILRQIGISAVQNK